MTEPADLGEVREHLMTTGLSEDTAPDEPMALFDRWLGYAEELAIHNANAMAVATADAQGRPSVRNVLLRGRLDGGLVFYTNYDSRKGVELAAHPAAEALFSWLDIERQVRFHGDVRRVSAEQSDDYFATRERESRISAIASAQSAVVSSRDELERRHREIDDTYRGIDPPRPDHWGGYVLVPRSVEFWQGRRHRFHDRLLYQLTDDGWSRCRLSP